MMRMSLFFALSLVCSWTVSRQGTTYTPSQVLTIGASLPVGSCTEGNVFLLTSATVGIYFCNSNTWQAAGIPGQSANAIQFIDTGTCPAGYSEVAGANGKTILGTVAANGDVGTTGGADTITPQGTNGAPTFTGTPFTAVINHTHPLATGTGSTGNFSQVIGTVDTSSGGTGGSPTQTALGTLSGNPSGGVASITPAGANSAPVFTGTPFDNRSAFVRWIACKKT